MKRPLMALLLSVLVLLPVLAQAAPVTGTYKSTDLLGGGPLLTGRASVWRPGINSGIPHVAHIQSWDGVSLGTQWDVSCAVENSDFLTQDYRVGDIGMIIYTSTFNGGTFSFYAGGGPWGDGTGTLGTTTLITIVQYDNVPPYGSIPVASVVNGHTSGVFSDGCLMTFAIANGSGVGETSSFFPLLLKPATYPTFLDANCAAASPGLQYGTWGDVTQITVGIDCTIADEQTTWGGIKSIYR